MRPFTRVSVTLHSRAITRMQSSRSSKNEQGRNWPTVPPDSDSRTSPVSSCVAFILRSPRLAPQLLPVTNVPFDGCILQPGIFHDPIPLLNASTHSKFVRSLFFY